MTSEEDVMRNANWLYRSNYSVLLLAFIWFLTGCAAAPKQIYTPNVPYTSRTQQVLVNSNPIPVTVRMVPLVDVSPPEDKVDGALYGDGWSATSSEQLKGDLAVLLTRAIADDLRTNNVFKELTDDQKDGQLVLGGKIYKFSQRREQYLWALCCGLIGVILPFPLMKEEGAVDLELTLSGEDGKTIKTYRGKSSFLKRCNFYESRCWQSYSSSPAMYLDEAFGDSLRQIREMIPKDTEGIVH